MKLQVAIDLHGTQQLIEAAEKLVGIADIIEVGTPIIMLEGLKAVKALRLKYPKTTILADTKIADGASLETQYAIDAGADIITVLAAMDNKTIEDCIKTAHASNKEVLVDLINVVDVAKRAEELDAMGADYISVHTASDVQSEKNNPLEDLRKISKVVKKAKISCAGGINLKTIHEIKTLNPDVVIVGSSITNALDPKAVAKEFKEILDHES